MIMCAGFFRRSTGAGTALRDKPGLIDEDASYVANGLPEFNDRIAILSATLQRVTGLDFFGVDFCVTPNRELVVFEANASMRSSAQPAWSESHPHSSIGVDRLVQAFEALVDAKINA